MSEFAGTLWFTTPPQVGPDIPYTFGIIGDLGQTFDSNSSLTCYEHDLVPGKAMLLLDGIYGEDSSREAPPTSPGFGQFPITKFILSQQLGETSSSSLLLTNFQHPSKHQPVSRHIGTRSRDVRLQSDKDQIVVVIMKLC